MENRTKKGLLIIISGPSGVGKGTIREKIMEDKSLNIVYSVSMTTRNIRPGEVDGKDYYFVSRDEFEKHIKNNELLEWAEYVGNYYGTPKQAVEDLRNKGENVLLEIEINGAEKVLSQVDDALSIFIAPPSIDALVDRLKGRGTESEEVIMNRVKKAAKELKHESLYKHTVINDELDRCVENIKKIIKENL